MRGREAAAELAALGVQVDHDLGDEAVLAEDVVEEQPQAGDLVVVDADEDRAPLGQHRAHRLEPRPHHLHPGAVPVGARTRHLVAVGERVPGVVRRVEVHHVVPLAGRREPGQHVEVVALDERVPRLHMLTLTGQRRGPVRQAARRVVRGGTPVACQADDPSLGARDRRDRHGGHRRQTLRQRAGHLARRAIWTSPFASSDDVGARRPVAADRDHRAVDEVAALLRLLDGRHDPAEEDARPGTAARTPARAPGVSSSVAAVETCPPAPVSEISGRTSAPVTGPGGRAVGALGRRRRRRAAAGRGRQRGRRHQGPEDASHGGRTCPPGSSVPSRVEEGLALAEDGQTVLHHEPRARLRPARSASRARAQPLTDSARRRGRRPAPRRQSAPAGSRGSSPRLRLGRA